jgi:DNA-nicking Smr family endonuclease
MKKPPPAIPEEERRLFLEAVAGTRPLPPSDRIQRQPPPAAPLPLKRMADDRAVLEESLSGPLSIEDRLDTGDEPNHLRQGLSRQVLRDLRRGRWIIEAEIDLHGATRDEARLRIGEFLADCLRHDTRCVRIVHGRGLRSPGRIGLLKILVRGWLAQRDEVLAYCQARPQDGGEGALIALLRARRKPGATAGS